MKNAEHQIQSSLIKWWGYAHKSLGVSEERLLFAIPNGGRRSIGQAVKLKREGVRPGVPDLFLAVPVAFSCGLFVELKAPDGRISPDQKTLHGQLHNEGYAVMVCWSFDEAKSAIECYLKTGDPFSKGNQ